MEHYLLAFCAAYGYVGLRSWQQSNVAHDTRATVIPVSVAMAAGDMVIWSAFATAGGISWIFLPIGIGGGLGCLTSMYLHKRWRKA